MVLQVPNKNYKPEEKIVSTPITHEVLAKETLYGISKKYKISIDKIKEANPIIEKEGLKLGTTITIPVTGEAMAVVVNTPKEETKTETKVEVKEEPKKEPKKTKKIEPKVEPKQETKPVVVEDQINGEEIVHEVMPKETKYGISKKYKVSIEELEKLNPEIVAGLPVGFKLVVKKGTNSTPTKTIAPQIEEEATNATASTTETTPVVDVAPLSPENMTKAEFLIAKASENLGAPYRSGGTSANGFDCSGLMFSTFKNVEMTLPRSSPEMANAGIKIERKQAQKGDLIFFATMGRRGVSHVGMVTEVSDDEIKFIHSATHSGVIISSTKEPYYAKRFVQVNRVLN